MFKVHSYKSIISLTSQSRTSFHKPLCKPTFHFYEISFLLKRDREGKGSNSYIRCKPQYWSAIRIARYDFVFFLAIVCYNDIKFPSENALSSFI